MTNDTRSALDVRLDERAGAPAARRGDTDTPALGRGRERITGVPFGRLLRVELRKMVDTRSGRWLLGAIGAFVVAVLAGVVIFDSSPTLGFSTLVAFALQPVAILLPVVGILAMTSEWSQRTALVTFTLEPRRARVIVAKCLAALLLGLAFVALVAALAAVATLIAGGVRPLADPWKFSGESFALVVLPVVLVLVQGLAFGLVLANSALAITLYYILPMLYGMLALWERARGFISWTDITSATAPAMTGHVSTEQWQHLGVASLCWIVAPLLAGLILTLRREVK